jgi:DNA sulfur modification protein DndD
MARLTIKQFTIENFGPFRERQLFNFEVPSKQPVILVQALNGSGKTTLLTAFQVLLYGQRGLGAGRTKAAFDSLIKGLLRLEEAGPAILEAILSIHFADSIKEYTVCRKWNIKNDGKLEERLTVYVADQPNLDISSEWPEFVESLLPAELIELFFFDGEKIEALANPDRLPDLLKRALEGFFGLGGIDTLGMNLRAIERRLLQSRVSAAETMEFDALEKKQLELRLNIDSLNQELASTQNAFDQASQELERYISNARQNGLEAFNKADSLRHDLISKKERVDHILFEINSALSDPLLPLVWLGAIWGDYTQAWEEDRNKQLTHRIVAAIEERDARILTSLANIIPKAANISIKNTLMADLAILKNETAGISYLTASENPLIVIDAVLEKKEMVSTLLNELKLARKGLEKAETRIQTIPEQDQLGSLLALLQELTRTKTGLELRIQELESSLTDARTQLEDTTKILDNKLSVVRKLHFESEHTALAVDASARAIETLAAFKNKLLANKAGWLAQKISTEFNRLSRKQKLISTVNVDPVSFAVSIQGASGKELPLERLSAGERQLFATAVLSALIRERKSPFPVVVDTPLARLDRSHRLKLVKGFFADVSHQVIVLSTDEEVVGSTYEGLKPYIGKEYLLQYQDTASASVVSELGDKSDIIKSVKVAA